MDLLSAFVCLELIKKQVQGWNLLELMSTNIEHARTIEALYALLMRSLNLGVR